MRSREIRFHRKNAFKLRKSSSISRRNVFPASRQLVRCKSVFHLRNGRLIYGPRRDKCTFRYYGNQSNRTMRAKTRFPAMKWIIEDPSKRMQSALHSSRINLLEKVPHRSNVDNFLLPITNCYYTKFLLQNVHTLNWGHCNKRSAAPFLTVFELRRVVYVKKYLPRLMQIE